jgi:hypothetical protein
MLTSGMGTSLTDAFDVLMLGIQRRISRKKRGLKRSASLEGDKESTSQEPEVARSPSSSTGDGRCSLAFTAPVDITGGGILIYKLLAIGTSNPSGWAPVTRIRPPNVH